MRKVKFNRSTGCIEGERVGQMKGATEYYRLIKKAEYRKLGDLESTKLGYRNHGGDAECYRNGNVIYITSSHARGETFFIYLIDEKSNLFEVYGVTSGNRGWTETYGWLHKGTWVKQILQYFRHLEREIVAHDERVELKKRDKEREKNKEIGEQVNKFNAMFR